MLTGAEREQFRKDFRAGWELNKRVLPWVIEKIIDSLPVQPEQDECEGCEWEDNHATQLTNKYVLCPFCTRYYKDRYQTGE